MNGRSYIQHTIKGLEEGGREGWGGEGGGERETETNGRYVTRDGRKKDRERERKN